MQNYKRRNLSRHLRASHLEVGDFLLGSVKVAKSSIITSLLVMLAVGIAIGIYVLNPLEKTVARNESIATETPVATEETFSNFETTATPKAEVSEDSIYPETYSEVVPSY